MINIIVQNARENNMRKFNFAVEFRFGTDSDKAAGTSGKKETLYNIGIAIICVAALIGWWL